MIHSRTLQSLEFDKISRFLADLCLSESGRRLAQDLKPLRDADEAKAALELYEEALAWASFPGQERFEAASFPDVGDIFLALDRQAAAGHANPRLDLEAFWALREMLRQGQKAFSSITGPAAGPGAWPHLLEIAQDTPFPQQLMAALLRCVSEDGQLKDESTPELFRLRGEMRRLHQNCLRKVKDFAQHYNILPYLQDEFMTLSSDRYVLPLKANFKGRLQGIIHDWSQTGETCYFEPIFLVEINNKLQELKHEEREEERKILEYLTGLLTAEREGALGCQRLLSLLDFLHAKMRFAAMLDAHSISFTPDDQGIELLGARHPILALARQQAGKGAQEPVRPVDIVLRPGERTLVITGGNAGGKTVCLKTTGLVSALAMSGMPVPVARGSHLPWFDRLDAFIGDEQSLDDNVSTFTAQIDHLAKAWKHLDNKGLVLLDEFGAGTDPAEGSALAQAVLDELLEKKCFVLAATHFPALKTYALTRAGVRAASMLFDPRTERPLFRLAYDQIGASQALAVAAAHGLPQNILARARHYLLQDGEDSSAIMARLNALAAEREEELARIRAEEEKNRRQLADRRASLEKEKQRLGTEMRAKISELMHAWKADKASAKQTLKAMSGLRKELGLPDEAENSSVLPALDHFAAGQEVLHAAFNKRGVITDVDERRKRARLDMNGVSLWAEMKDLRHIGQAAAKDRPRATPVKSSAEPAALNLDVRGLRAEEAISQVERFLDRALLAGFSQVEIVHGRGTGALRREIHQFLHSFPAVDSISLAPEDRGGDGMTIVNLN